MKGFILLVLAVFAAVGTVESCALRVFGYVLTIFCLPHLVVPKCFLMKAEMYRARNKLSVRGSITGKPVETAFVDNDGIYDPDCEADGRFKAKQCNKTEECWCVNSAGVRRTDKGDKNIKCEELVET
ncbi:hypothetical protein GOODEAATRI_015290 [Goodea atripinnis]|uniref:Thyroglobulin type-1 domain-containing protein n=1 Tax=Goodea atripinnis TaxID=208336 RepID=A0ABV0NAV6_9TELE